MPSRKALRRKQRQQRQPRHSAGPTRMMPLRNPGGRFTSKENIEFANKERKQRELDASKDTRLNKRGWVAEQRKKDEEKWRKWKTFVKTNVDERFERKKPRNVKRYTEQASLLLNLGFRPKPSYERDILNGKAVRRVYTFEGIQGPSLAEQLLVTYYDESETNKVKSFAQFGTGYGPKDIWRGSYWAHPKDTYAYVASMQARHSTRDLFENAKNGITKLFTEIHILAYRDSITDETQRTLKEVAPKSIKRKTKTRKGNKRNRIVKTSTKRNVRVKLHRKSVRRNKPKSKSNIRKRSKKFSR